MSSDGNFVNLTASTINGAVVATSSEVANTTANNKVITPNTLSYILARPPAIGSATPGNASASITGAAVASVSDIASAASGKFITKCRRESPQLKQWDESSQEKELRHFDLPID